MKKVMYLVYWNYDDGKSALKNTEQFTKEEIIKYGLDRFAHHRVTVDKIVNMEVGDTMRNNGNLNGYIDIIKKIEVVEEEDGFSNPNQLDLFNEHEKDVTQKYIDEIKDELQDSITELQEAIEKFENAMKEEGSPWRKYLAAVDGKEYNRGQVVLQLRHLSGVNTQIGQIKHCIKELK